MSRRRDPTHLGPVDLDDPGLDWIESTIPGSSPPVRLVRLHADAETGASVTLVAFPPGWTRPGTGHYPCAEEFVVLDGRIEITGEVYPAGEYVYLPPRATRTDGVVGPEGCRALAWFSGRPAWTPGEASISADHAAQDVPLDAAGPGAGRDRHHEVPGTSVVLGNSETTGDALDAVRDAVSVAGRRWALAEPRMALPDLPGPVLVRSWS